MDSLTIPYILLALSALGIVVSTAMGINYALERRHRQ